ncbi:hypothetical protein N9K26_02860 [Flavobacteriales bacterium]|nr:hypothetical protein [Flavobacteriales bacterium]
MKKQFSLAILIFITLLFSCKLIKIETPGSISNTYPKFLKESNLKVKFNETDICNKVYNDTVYALKGSELKTCLADVKKAIVYIWSPFCKSDACLSIGAVQDYCNENGYDLFVVLETYDSEIINVQRSPTRPYFSIDHLYHESNAMDKHWKSFTKELTIKSKPIGRYMEFIGGKHSSMIDLNKLINK